MTRYIARRVLLAAVVVLLVTVVTFVLLHCCPAGRRGARSGSRPQPSRSPPSTPRRAWTGRCPCSTGAT